MSRERRSLPPVDPKLNSIVGLIRALEANPALYCGHRSIFALVAYIVGWSDAKGEELTDAAILDGFPEWLRRRCGISSNQPWPKLILFLSADEADAMATFFSLFEVDLAECKQGAYSRTYDPSTSQSGRRRIGNKKPRNIRKTRKSKRE